ncbi:hypothetical protein HU147_05535 [Planomicrobium chinense]|uniref:hypothetical protein n=1 Tax=Planococcus chinensis TaxID=272917 RepID=UPI001CC4695D|nr:hypothetical protein [Planococcus chinensis]MBZ5200671.1 hypothetical protein [Planococcus chinensis]
MKAPEEILAVWKKFSGFPMETLTKAWFYSRSGDKKQRTVALMKEHKAQYGITGNCFDLAIWLLDELKRDGIEAYPIGNELGTEEAHAALIALDTHGNRYLCDLGDQWLQPVLIEARHEAFSTEKQSGFFPAADVQVLSRHAEVEIIYHRPGGKQSRQTYDTTPVTEADFWQAGEFSQNHVYPKPLVEVRLPYKEETAHWEFDNWKSFLSTTEGLYPDQPLATLEEWVDRIGQKTGFDHKFLFDSLNFYKQMKKESRR